MGAREHFLAELEAGRSSLPGAALPWLAQARAAAVARFASLGLPTQRDEEWKYTSVAALERQAFSLAPHAGDAAGALQLAPYALAGSHLLVFVNGHHVSALSHPGQLPQGVTLASLADALAREPERCAAWFDGAAEDSHGFAALNGAAWTDGALIELAAGCTLEAPIELLFVTTRGNLASHTRNLVRAGAGARAEIVEHHLGLCDEPYLSNALTRMVLEPGARLGHAKLQQEGARAWHVAEVHAEQQRDSHYASCSIALGGLSSRCGISTRFDDEGCEAELLGLYLAEGRQHMDHHTRIDHASPRGTSRQLYKGVVDGGARAVFNGKVVVQRDAQGSDAAQTNRNLLLSSKAEVDTKPQLEIWADDVKCSHGATVGQLDPEQIFYLRTRGVAEPVARALLAHAFAAEVVNRISLRPLQARLEHLLRDRLPSEVRALR
jgi:Fe-S cluster assembly protein SufD